MILGASPVAVSNLIGILGQSQLSVFWKTGEIYFENFGYLRWIPGRDGVPAKVCFEPSLALQKNMEMMQNAWEAEKFFGSTLFEKRLQKLQ